MAEASETAIPPPPIPSVYFNGFEVNNSLSDMILLLLLNGVPVVRLNLSFTTAKTLAKYLQDTVANFEKNTKHKIMTMDDVNKRLEAKSE